MRYKKIKYMSILLFVGLGSCKNEPKPTNNNVNTASENNQNSLETESKVAAIPKRKNFLAGTWAVSERTDTFTVVRNAQSIRVVMMRDANTTYAEKGTYNRTQTVRLLDKKGITVLSYQGALSGRWKFEEDGRWLETVDSCDLAETVTTFTDGQKIDCAKIKKGIFQGAKEVNFEEFSDTKISFKGRDPNGLGFHTVLMKQY